MNLLFPINGDILHVLDGTITNEGLQVFAKIAADPSDQITVNGQSADQKDGIFTAPLLLTNYHNTVTVKNHRTGEEATVNVYWSKKFAGGYRLSIDDNIRFLQDIAQNANVYNSIFENPFLNGLLNIHKRYGTKVHLNLFYQSVDAAFTLSAFPDMFKEEWQRNSNWLRLSFHAYKEFPDAPYKNASFQTVKDDCDLVMGEIKRFAGHQLMGPVTTVHWGEVTIEGSRALRAAGYKGQLGYFNVDDDLPPVSYYLDVEKRRHMKKRFIWKDEAEDIIFIRSSIVLDRKENHEIVPFLDAYREAGTPPPYADFLIHEQYFYPDYAAYQPDYFERIETAVKWATDHHYKPAFLDESIFS
ncbi:MAG: hypothetical protein K2P88_01085 [Chitinophagaceae bacterium]|uniref:hypothetical protein n=1 Tax=unclassified Paraflavitalea TaxID=2798305 RepID=UPI003D33973B|nr:hypothetical protein [Chitinophagaceae bacterium]